MSEESSPGDASRPIRRIVSAPEQRMALPVALIAHKGEERDQLEARIARSHPVITFPSFAHFGADAAQRARWAGIVVARTHAWDARLDNYVLRRAFIALFQLADEGYGWPETVRRLATPEELDSWLSELSSSVLPPDDRAHALKPKAKAKPKRSSLFDTHASSGAQAARVELAPARGSVPASIRPAKAQLELPVVEPVAAAATQSDGEQATVHGTSSRAKAASDRPRSERVTAPTASKKAARDSAGVRPRAAAHARAQRDGVELRPSAAPASAAEGRATAVRGKPSAKRSVAKAASAREERRLSALALEIGLVRAQELLSLVRMRARSSEPTTRGGRAEGKL
jgi:hypothetical protein